MAFLCSRVRRSSSTILIAAAFAAPLSAEILFVDRNDAACSDQVGAPYCSIAAAALAAADGDTVEVAAGEYDEEIVIYRRITLRGAGPGADADDPAATVVRRLSEQARIVAYATGASEQERLVIEDLRVETEDFFDALTFAVDGDLAHVTLDRVALRGDHGVIVHQRVDSVTDFVVANSELSGNNEAGVLFRTTGIVEDLRITNCLLEENGEEGIRLLGPARGLLIEDSDLRANALEGLDLREFGSGSLLENLEVVDNGAPWGQPGIRLESARDAEISRLSVRGSGSDGLRIGSDSIGGNLEDLVVRDFEARENEAAGISFQFGGVLENVAVRNCRLEKNATAGFEFRNSNALIDVSVRGCDVRDNQRNAFDVFAVDGVEAHCNNLVGHTEFGLRADDPIDASGNWWGCVGGPGEIGCDLLVGTARTEFALEAELDFLDFGDEDGDDWLDACDECVGTPPETPTDASGCGIDQLCPCTGPKDEPRPWNHHGEYVTCVVREARRFRELGLITPAEQGQIVSAAAQSPCGKRPPVPAGPETEAAQATGVWAFEPTVAMTPDLGFFAAWSAPDGDGSGVFARIYDADGEPVDEAFRVHEDPSGEQTRPFAARTPEGETWIAWQSLAADDDGWSVRMRRFDLDGRPLGGEEQVHLSPTGDQIFPVVVADGDGAVISWLDRAPVEIGSSGSMLRLFARRYSSDGSPFGEEMPLVEDIADFPHASAILPDGFAAAQTSIIEGTRSVVVRRFDFDGQAFGSEIFVGSQDLHSWNAAMTVHDGGEWATIWLQECVDARTSVLLQRFDAFDEPLFEPIVVAPCGAAAPGRPQIAQDEDGHMIVSWVALDVDRESVRMQRFGRDGIPYSDPVRIDSGFAFSSRSSVFATDAAGETAALWEDIEDDVSSLRIRRYRNALFADSFESGDRVAWEKP